MINSITADHGNLAVLTAATAAFHTRAPIAPSPLPIVKPDPELVRGIGRTLDRDAAHRTSPDIQSLIDGLLSNFGTERDLPETDEAQPEVSSTISDNNQGSREAVESLEKTAAKGQETSSILEQKSPTQQARNQSEASQNLSGAESDLTQAESLSERASDATLKANELRTQLQSSQGLSSEDSKQLTLSVQLFDQKSAAAEAAARLRKAMARKVLKQVTSRVDTVQEVKNGNGSDALSRLEGDRDFFQRIQEMHRILQKR